MILKGRDSRKNDLFQLTRLLRYNLTPRQRFLIEREINSIKKGKHGEDDSAYYINFYYGDSKRWIVIHDLRFEINGKVAQIDHILINRLFDVYVLESKNYKYGLRITENGEFEVYHKNNFIGIPSPIEQNKRHIAVLRELIRCHDLLPKRFSVSIRPRFLNYVLISPQSVIRRPNPNKFDSSNVIKADTLTSVIEENAEKIGNIEAITSLAKISSISVVQEFGKKLVAFHKLSNIDWKKKFGVLEHAYVNKKYFCARCKANISEKEAKFCWNNKKRFRGRAFCYKCQEKITPYRN